MDVFLLSQILPVSTSIFMAVFIVAREGTNENGTGSSRLSRSFSPVLYSLAQDVVEEVRKWLQKRDLL
jgi:hypothetical protein